MTTKTISTSPTPIPVPPRCERWQAPTGRYLERGNLFHVKDVGWFKFLAYVESAEPHIEAVAVTRSGERTVGGVRCLRPERIGRTSKKVAR